MYYIFAVTHWCRWWIKSAGSFERVEDALAWISSKTRALDYVPMLCDHPEMLEY